MKPRVLVALSTFAEHDAAPLSLLESSRFECVVNPLKRRLARQEIVELGAGCVGVIAGVEPYDELVLAALTDLRCISRCGVGTDNIALAAAASRGIIVCNTPDVVVQPVAELTIAFIFDLLKRVTAHTVLLRAGRWEKLSGRLLAGKTVGLIGFGRIGRRVAELLVPFGVRVIGCDPAADRSWASATGVDVVPLDDVLAGSDVVSLHVAVSAETPFVLGRDELARMKAGSYLVNVARGSLIDENALVEALQSGRLAGAALDVHSTEPYHGSLLSFDQVLLTPHVATLTFESRAAMEFQATRNLIDVLASLRV